MLGITTSVSTALILMPVSIGVAHRADDKLVPERRAILAIVQQFELDMIIIANERFAKLIDISWVCIWALEKAAIAADDFFGGVAGEIKEGEIGKNDRVVRLVRIAHDHRHARALDGYQRKFAASGRQTFLCCCWRIAWKGLPLLAVAHT